MQVDCSRTVGSLGGGSTDACGLVQRHCSKHMGASLTHVHSSDIVASIWGQH